MRLIAIATVLTDDLDLDYYPEGHSFPISITQGLFGSLTVHRVRGYENVDMPDTRLKFNHIVHLFEAFRLEDVHKENIYATPDGYAS